MQLSGLSDTCWIDAHTGAQVCGAGDPTGETNCSVGTPYYSPSSGGQSGDGSPARQFYVTGNQLIWIPSSGNKRAYAFLYHSGNSDVYQLSSGNGCKEPKGWSCSFAVVSSSGVLSFAASAPAKSELGCQNITTAVASGNTTAVVTSNPVYTGPTTPSFNSSMPAGYSALAVTTPKPAATGFSLSSIPTWALIAGAAGGGLLISKMMGKR